MIALFMNIIFFKSKLQYFLQVKHFFPPAPEAVFSSLCFNKTTSQNSRKKLRFFRTSTHFEFKWGMNVEKNAIDKNCKNLLEQTSFLVKYQLINLMKYTFFKNMS